MHLPTFHHNLVVPDLADWKKRSTVKMYQYTDDLMLTSDLIKVLEKAAPSLTAHLQKKGWAINPWEVKDQGCQSNFLVLSSWVLPSAIIDKVQAFPVPMTPKQLQEFWGIVLQCLYDHQYLR